MKRTLTIALAAALAAMSGAPADTEPVTESFTHEGRTLLYRYDPGDLPASGRPPGLLLFFHGHNEGS